MNASHHITLDVPVDVKPRLSNLLPRLEELGVRRLEVFSYGRPGDATYWMAYLFTEEGRHTLGTPDLRHLALDVQSEDLVRQLDSWTPRPRGDPELLASSHGK